MLKRVNVKTLLTQIQIGIARVIARASQKFGTPVFSFWSLFVLTILFSANFVFSTAAFAQAPATGNSSGANAGASGKGKRTSIDFEDQLIEGSTQKPELFYLLQQRPNNVRRLIRLREDFLPEMRKTSEDIQQKGSVD